MTITELQLRGCLNNDFSAHEQISGNMGRSGARTRVILFGVLPLEDLNINKLPKLRIFGERGKLKDKIPPVACILDEAYESAKAMMVERNARLRDEGKEPITDKKKLEKNLKEDLKLSIKQFTSDIVNGFDGKPFETYKTKDGITPIGNRQLQQFNLQQNMVELGKREADAIDRLSQVLPPDEVARISATMTATDPVKRETVAAMQDPKIKVAPSSILMTTAPIQKVKTPTANNIKEAIIESSIQIPVEKVMSQVIKSPTNNVNSETINKINGSGFPTGQPLNHLVPVGPSGAPVASVRLIPGYGRKPAPASPPAVQKKVIPTDAKIISKPVIPSDYTREASFNFISGNKPMNNSPDMGGLDFGAMSQPIEEKSSMTPIVIAAAVIGALLLFKK